MGLDLKNSVTVHFLNVPYVPLLGGLDDKIGGS